MLNALCPEERLETKRGRYLRAPFETDCILSPPGTLALVRVQCDLELAE